jgi:hypothetical protein
LRSNELHRTDKASGIASGEKLLRIVACAAASAEFLWRREFDVERSVKRGSVAVPAPGGLGASLVKHIYGHGGLPLGFDLGFDFDVTYIAHN